MKQNCFYLLTWIFIGCSCTVYAQDETAPPIVVIDPGHGGVDSGAIGENGIKEKDIALRIAIEILRLNRQLFNNTLEIYSTRYTDTLISLRHRTLLANSLKADIFISVHFNQASRKKAQGIELYIKKGNEQSVNLSRLFEKGLKEKLGFKNRGVRNGDFQILRETEHCASVLLELGFLSNPEEEKHNYKDSSISAFALVILETLLNQPKSDRNF